MAVPHGGINVRAQTGFAKSAAYDQHRPTYPAESVQTLLEETRVAGKEGAKIIDLAAGTGKLTEALSAREERYDIVAVEPHSGMRDVLAAKTLSGVTVVAGTAEAIPVPDDAVDAVLVGQAFHWFANEQALRELHRVLQPHGTLGLAWNIEHYNAPRSHKAATRWEGQLQDLIWSFHDNEPRFRHEKWRRVFDDQIKSTPLSIIKAADPLFSLPLGEHREQWEVWLPKEKVWDRFNTLSQIASLEGEKREETHRAFLDAINGPDVEVNAAGEVALHGTTYTVWTSKVPADGRAELTSVERSAP